MLTNFAALTSEQKTVWSMDLWEMARNMSFVNKFMGSDENSVIQHVTELKKTEKGNRAVITLLADLVGDGVAGDRTLEGNEEAMMTSDQVIRFDQIRDAVRNKGRMSDQKTVVSFRNNARNRLAYWLSDRVDQMAFLTMAGISYTMYPNGAMRVGSDLQYLEFAADVTPPTDARRLRWDATDGLVQAAATTDIVAADKVTWNTFVQLKAYAKERYIRGVRESSGQEVYHAFLTPTAMATLKQDEDYILNLRHAQERGDKNELFTGTSVKIDGIYLHEYRHVPSTRGAADGDKYGAAGDVDGCQILFCGAQALGMADIGSPYWDEEGFDYENQQGISVGKMIGFLKPKFYTIYEKAVEDFGVITCYVAVDANDI